MTEVAALHALRIGDSGEVVVFLHGLFGQGKNFTTIARALTPRFRSVLVDLPDHGRSPWTDRFDYVAVADTVAAVVRDEVGPHGRAHVVGHSMGGKVAMVLALRHPELVDRLVVIDIAPDLSDGAGEFEDLLDSLAAVDLASVERRGQVDDLLAGPIRSDTVRGFLLQNLRTTPEGLRWRANLALLRRDLPAIGGFPALDGVFDRPVLWMAGERSDYIRPEHDATMRRLFPRTRKITVRDAGHWVHSEQPAAVVAALQAFLAAQPA